MCAINLPTVKKLFVCRYVSGREKVVHILTLFRPGGGLLRPYQTLKLNNFKAVKAMTTKFSDFS